MEDKHESEEKVAPEEVEVKDSHKLEADGEELSKAVAKAAEHAKETAGVAAEKAKELTGKASEKVSELVTKENLEKASQNVQQALEKVESYNKNQLFDKIRFGVCVLVELTFVYFFWTVLQLHQLSNGANSASLTQGLNALGQGMSALKSMSQAITFGRVLMVILFVFAMYGTYMRVVKNKKTFVANVNITTDLTIIFALVGNLLARDSLKALAVAVDAMNGNFGNLLSLGGMDTQAISSGSTILVVCYLLALVANTATLYFLYQKLFAKK